MTRKVAHQPGKRLEPSNGGTGPNRWSGRATAAVAAAAIPTGPLYDDHGWQPNGVHRKTGTSVSPDGVPFSYASKLREAAPAASEADITRLYTSHVPVDFAAEGLRSGGSVEEIEMHRREGTSKTALPRRFGADEVVVTPQGAAVAPRTVAAPTRFTTPALRLQALVGRFAQSLNRAKEWYLSVGVTPEPPNATEPMDRDAEERRVLRAAYASWLVENGYTEPGGYNSLGVDPWGKIRGQQLEGKLVNVLTGKPWTPTGYLRGGLHAKTDTPYSPEPDGADEEGWQRPQSDGRRLNVLTGTVFGPDSPAKTFNGQTVEQYWADHRLTPDAEARMEADREENEAISLQIAAELKEEAVLERKIRMQQRRGPDGRFTS